MALMGARRQSGLVKEGLICLKEGNGYGPGRVLLLCMYPAMGVVQCYGAEKLDVSALAHSEQEMESGAPTTSAQKDKAESRSHMTTGKVVYDQRTIKVPRKDTILDSKFQGSKQKEVHSMHKALNSYLYTFLL